MKKFLILIMISIVSFLGIKDVKADTLDFEYQYSFSDVSSEDIIDDIDAISYMCSLLYSYYINNYSEYPYYSYSFAYSNNNKIVSMILYNNIPQTYYDNGLILFDRDKYVELSLNIRYVNGAYVIDDSLGIGAVYPLGYDSLQNFTYELFRSDLNLFTHFYYFYSNFDLINNTDYTINISKFNNNVSNNLSISPNSIIPTLYDTLNLSFFPTYDNFIEIDLNKYPYVALSLKDYNVDVFDTVMYVKGQLCPSGVYNYGMTSKEDYKNGYQVTDRCNIAYDNFTPTKFYILDNDLKNHAIWYLKAYDTSIENKIKVDSNIFNIHYITEEKKDNPILNINGKNYSTIPYDELPSTATKNESENFVPGASEEFTFEGFFDKPLDALKSVWGAITSVFAIITEFILLLPPTMQGFLYTSFGIAIVLGIIKILL